MAELLFHCVQGNVDEEEGGEEKENEDEENRYETEDSNTFRLILHL